MLGNQTVRLFPNPTAVFVTIASGTFTRYAIISVTGQQVLGGDLVDGQVDLRELPAGNYVMSLFDNSGKAFSALLIKE